jgi:ubiquinol-cytochrome c reductase cytochrome c subunit
MRASYRIAFTCAFVLLSPALAILGISGERGRNAPPDQEEEQERRALAKRAVGENCAICHSLDLVEGQRLTPPQWKAEVEKMIGWGSPIAPEQTSIVIGYLAAEYPVERKPAELGKLTASQALGSILPLPPDANQRKGDAARGEGLYAKNCASCHGAEAQGSDLGPILVERPIVVRWSEFSSIIRKGQGRMPGFSSLLDAQAEADILTWVRQRRYQGTRVK